MNICIRSEHISVLKVGNGGGVRWASVDVEDTAGGGGGSNSRLAVVGGGGGSGGIGGGGPRIPGGAAGGGGTPPDSFVIARAKSLNRRVLLNVGGTKHEVRARGGDLTFRNS